MRYLKKTLIEAFKLLTVCNPDEVQSVHNKYAILFNDRDLFIELIELLYSFWRNLERYTIVHNSTIGNGLQSVRFMQANELFNELILSIYRHEYFSLYTK